MVLGPLSLGLGLGLEQMGLDQKSGTDTKECAESVGLCVGEFLSLFDLQADTVYE